ncbi:hypothetical protein GCM10018952_54170 [Streptosporangium vulgare]
MRTNARAQMPSIAVHEAYRGPPLAPVVDGVQPPAGPQAVPPRTRRGLGLYVEKLTLHEQGYFTTPAQ